MSDMNIYEKFLLYFFSLSTATSSLAFLLSTYPGGNWASRFLPNLFYNLIIILMFLFSKIRLTNKVKAISIIYILCYIFIGSYNYKIWANINFKPKRLGIEHLISVLEANNLHFGYGDKFGVQSNSFGVLTNYKIVVAGMTDSFYPTDYSSSYFFNIDKVPNHRKYFIVIPNKTNPWWHLKPEDFMNKVTSFFGKPSKIIKLNHYTIIVWNHKLNFHNIR